MTIELNGSISEVEIMCQEIRKGGGGCDSSKKLLMILLLFMY